MATTLQGADETPQPPINGQTPPLPPADPPESGSAAGKTVEEVEEAWRYRVSQKDKAHAAAEQALREENDRLKRQLEGASASRPPTNGQQDGGGNDAYLRDQLAEAKREAEQERQLRVIETKRAKYPALARSVGSDNSIFAADDATLARLNVLADDDSSSGTFAPTTPRKAAPAPPKSLGDMSKQELEAELKRAVESGGHIPKR